MAEKEKKSAEKDTAEKQTATKAEKPTEKEKVTAKQAAKGKSDNQKDAKSQELQQQVDDLKKQLDEKNDSYLRAEAEIQNMNKHFSKERSDLLKYDGQKMAKAILPAVDNLERALAIKVDDDAGKQLLKGIQMTHDRLIAALKENGVTAIEADGKEFDPTKHQAVSTVKAQGDQKPDTVVKVLQTGYQLHDRVLRPSMVVVAQ